MSLLFVHKRIKKIQKFQARQTSTGKFFKAYSLIVPKYKKNEYS